MYINYFKTALYSSAIVMKFFNNSRKAEIITVKLKDSLLLNMSLCIRPLTFITEALHLVATVRCSFCSYVVPQIPLGIHDMLYY